MNEKTFAKAPKILPWLAHKAGIDDQRALHLWHAALRYAAHTHTPNTSAYWQAAMAHLQDLIAAESTREDAASFGWRPWARSLAELWTVRLGILDDLAMAPVRTWRIIGHHLHNPLTH